MKYLFPFCLFFRYYSYKNEIKHKVGENYTKRSVVLYEKNTCEGQYRRFITNFAWSFVHKQLRMFYAFQNVGSTDKDSNLFEGSSLQVPIDSCTCQFWTSLSLPCVHIFMLRSQQKLSLFEESLVDNRWTMRQQYTDQTSSQIELTNNSNKPTISEDQ